MGKKRTISSKKAKRPVGGTRGSDVSTCRVELKLFLVEAIESPRAGWRGKEEGALLGSSVMSVCLNETSLTNLLLSPVQGPGRAGNLSLKRGKLRRGGKKGKAATGNSKTETPQKKKKR